MEYSEHNPIKVLHAPIAALYQPALMVKGLRAHQQQADLLYHQNNFSNFHFGIQDPIVLGTGAIATATLHFFLKALNRYDVFHLHSGYSPIFQSRKGKEIGFLSKLGKLVVLSRWGCSDGRTRSSWNAERGLCNICPIKLNNCNDALNFARLKREETHADIIINHECDFKEFNKDCVFLHGFIDVDFWNPGIKIPEQFRIPKKEDNVVILHAVGGSNRGDVKGTSAIRIAIKRLKTKGLKIDYREIHGISFQDLRYHILQSDIVIDQLFYGSFGSFARESLALGKPVIGNVIKFQRGYLPGLPIIQANSETLEETLEPFIISPALRNESGKKGREYANNNLCHIKNSSKLLEFYREGLEKKHAVN